MSKFTKSAIDWKKLESLVPPEQSTNFFTFKAKNYIYRQRMLVYPAELPKIDWEMYKQAVPVPGLVDKLKSQYEAIKIPYPEDKLSAEVDAEWTALQPEIKKFCDEMQGHIDQSKKELERIDSLPKFDNMTIEMFYDMYPNDSLDFVKKPTFWPHTADEQLDYKDPTTKVEH